MSNLNVIKIHLELISPGDVNWGSEALLPKNFRPVSQLLGIFKKSDKKPPLLNQKLAPPPNFLHLLHYGYITHNPMLLYGRTHDTILMLGSYGLFMANFGVNFNSDERSKSAPECIPANVILKIFLGAKAWPFSTCFHQPCK